jgi:hypothetical protein
MEADISIWRKTGHFYFALTCVLLRAEKGCCSPLRMAEKNESSQEATCARKKL